MDLSLGCVAPQPDEVAVGIAEVGEFAHAHHIGLGNHDLAAGTLDGGDRGIHVRGQQVSEDAACRRRTLSGRLGKATDPALDPVLAGPDVDVIGAGDGLELPVEDRSVERLGALSVTAQELDVAPVTGTQLPLGHLGLASLLQVASSPTGEPRRMLVPVSDTPLTRPTVKGWWNPEAGTKA